LGDAATPFDTFASNRVNWRQGKTICQGARPGVRIFSNPHVQDALAYTLIALRKSGEAQEEIDSILKMVGNAEVMWQNEIRTRVTIVKSKLR
jgi:hypothetical protein